MSVDALVSGPPVVAFSDWVDGREVPHLSTNAGAPQLAFQHWRNFKESFAPELIGQAFEETSADLGHTVRDAVDPFGGSGTTALACQFLGVHPTTIEVNPYLADLIEAKLATYNVKKLVGALRTVAAVSTREYTDPFPGAPSTFVEPGRQDRYLFSKAVANRLATLRDAIEELSDQNSRRLLRVLLGAAAIDVSNVVVSGKGRRYRRNWKSKEMTAAQLDEHFVKLAVQATYEIQRYRDRPELNYSLIRGDARTSLTKADCFDMAVFSPPYPNSFDYTDVYNVELWVCGYLASRSDNRNLRESTLRSHVQIKRDFTGEVGSSELLERTLSQLSQMKEHLWNASIPDMVRAYFCDMTILLRSIRVSLREGGRAYAVVGDSRYANVDVPVAGVLREIAENEGFAVVGCEPFRSMRASPQQGGREELMETLLVLRRE